VGVVDHGIEPVAIKGRLRLVLVDSLDARPDDPPHLPAETLHEAQ
jgi:hypothetical protein